MRGKKYQELVKLGERYMTKARLKGSIYYEDPVSRLTIQVSYAAEREIRAAALPDFVESLREFMRKTGYTWAYVGKDGCSIRVNLGGYGKP